MPPQMKGAPATVFGEGDLSAKAPFLQQVRSSNALFARLLQLQSGLADEAAATLALEPLTSRLSDERGVFVANTEQAQASACVTTLSGDGGVGYVVAAIACAKLGFGVTRTLGWAPPGTDAPHLALEWGPGAAAGSVQCYLSLMQRAEILLDLGPSPEEEEDRGLYSQKYCESPPGWEGLPSFEELHAKLIAAPDWVAFEPRGLLMRAAGGGVAMSYTFPASEENLALLEGTATAVLRLWLAHLAQNKSSVALSPAATALVRRYDSAHRGAVRADPGNAQAAAMFGQEAVGQLVDLLVLEPSLF